MRRVAALGLVVLIAGCGSTVQSRTALETGGNTSGTELGVQSPGGQGGTTTGGQSLVPGGGATSGGIVGAGTGGGSSTTGTGTGVPGGGATSGTSGGQSSAPPGTRITTPIQLGFMTTTVGNAQNFGLNVGSNYSDRQFYDALVTEFNKRGGVAGRRIIPVYGDTDTASSDWNTQFSAACSKLTQDNKVQAVLGYIFVFLDSFEQCLAKANVAHLSAGYQPGDQASQRRFPNLVSTAHPTVEVSNLTVFTGAIQTGLLTKKNKLGVLLDACSHGDRAFANSTEPFLKAQGITYEVQTLDCANGSSDIGPAATSVKNAQLQFSAHGVDRVAAAGIPLLLFMENAESQGYRPEYLTSLAGAALEPNASAAQLAHLHGFGWMPSVDVNGTHQPEPLRPAQRLCLSMLKAHGIIPPATTTS